MGYRKIIALFFLFFLQYNLLHATHIVGGDIYYDLINQGSESNTYLVTLKVYMDCENGNPLPIKEDRTAILGVFDCDNDSNLLLTQEEAHPPIKHLGGLNYTCIKPLQDACISEHIYTYNLTLPHNNKGYLLSFQRCCRNKILLNIIDPLSTGANYHIFIPGANRTLKNNAARFKNLPPAYLCTDTRLIFDHSAIDPDGDSLVYELFHPYKGGGTAIGQDRPNPPNKPPLENVLWKSPYQVNNMIEGKEKLKINPHTGWLTAYPTQVGQYVVGIKVKEFRDGNFIGETLRDYQFYVRKCFKNVLANFESNTLHCSDTIFFKSYAENENSLHWDFGVETSESDTSNVKNPYFVFDNNGPFNVTLIAKNGTCIDTATQWVGLKGDHVLKVDLDSILCHTDELGYVTKELPIPENSGYLWSDGETDSVIMVDDTGTYWVRLTYEMCEVYDTFNVILGVPKLYLPNKLYVCEGVEDSTIKINDKRFVRFKWMDNPNLNTNTFQIKDTGTYWVEATGKYCSTKDTFSVNYFEFPQQFDKIVFCEDDTLLVANGLPSATFLWDDGSTLPTRKIKETGMYWVEVHYKNCFDRDSFLAIHPRLQAGFEFTQCPPIVKFNNQTDPREVQFSWVYDKKELSTSSAPILNYPIGNVSKIDLIASYGQGCTDTFEVDLSTIDFIPHPIKYYNVFTPNNDGYNDCFHFETLVEECTDIYWIVYNRWGELLFESETLLECWNGRDMKTNKLVPEGTYFWLARYQNKNENDLSGTVQLIRD